MKKVFFLAVLACIMSTATAATTTPASSTEEVVVKPPKKGKKGFNYGAHAKKNKAGAKRSSQKFKRSGGDLTRYKCR